MDRDECFYCGKAADPRIPSLIPYCPEDWQSEHPNVRARLTLDYASGRDISTIVDEMLANAEVIHIEQMQPEES